MSIEKNIFQNNQEENYSQDINEKIVNQSETNFLNNIWIKVWIKSFGYKPKLCGFKLDGKTGDAEVNNLFVIKKFLTNGSLRYTVITKTTTYTALLQDDVILCNGTFTVNLPATSGINGKEFIIKNVGTGIITVDPYNNQTIDGETTQELNQYDAIHIINDGTLINSWHII